MILYGVGGTNGSGKDTVGELLAANHGFLFVSNSDLLREEARRRGLPIEREYLRQISAEWRRELGLGALIDKAVELFDPSKYQGLVTASLRNPGENDRVHELGGKVIWTDADPHVRYERIYSRQRTAEDDKTFEQFLAEEEVEMHQSGDAATLSLSAVKERADIFISNSSNDINNFLIELEEALGLPITKR